MQHLLLFVFAFPLMGEAAVITSVGWKAGFGKPVATPFLQAAQKAAQAVKGTTNGINPKLWPFTSVVHVGQGANHVVGSGNNQLPSTIPGANILPWDRSAGQSFAEAFDNWSPEFSEETSNDKQNESKEKKEERKVCKSIPDVENSDQQKMQDCRNTEVDKFCKIYCLPGYHLSNTNSDKPRNKRSTNTNGQVQCTSTGQNQAVWNINNHACVQPPDVVCREGNNNAVDWFIIYRFPAVNGVSRYMLMTSANPGVWNRMGEFGGGDGSVELRNTLAPLGEVDVHYIMYSDQPSPVGTADENNAHSKGVLAVRGNRGFFLPHTQPRFPRRRNNPTGRWSNLKAQIYMCVSFEANSQLNILRRYVERINANIYEGELPGIVPHYAIPNIVYGGIAESRFQSLRGTIFTLYAKAPGFHVDIYRVLSSTRRDLEWYTQTYRGGGAQHLASDCPNNDYDLNDIHDVWLLETDNGFGMQQWRASHDHSKWVVNRDHSTNGDVWCLGDMNRDTTQMDRPGGLVCLSQGADAVAAAFRRMVIEDECDWDEDVARERVRYETYGRRRLPGK